MRHSVYGRQLNASRRQLVMLAIAKRQKVKFVLNDDVMTSALFVSSIPEHFENMMPRTGRCRWCGVSTDHVIIVNNCKTV